MEEFVKQHSISAIQSFTKPAKVHPLVFAQFCVYYYAELEKLKMASDQSNTSPSNLSTAGVSAGLADPATKSKTPQNFSNFKKKSKETYLEGFMGTVTVGDKHRPLCIPANSSLTVQGHTSKLPYHAQCMAEQAECSNLPLGLVINCTLVKPSKSRLIPMILINTNSYNVWIRQPLLAAELYDVDYYPWEYETTVNHEEDSDTIKFGFQPVPTAELQADIMATAQELVQEEDNGGDNEDKG